jgi:hypothetical protein
MKGHSKGWPLLLIQLFEADKVTAMFTFGSDPEFFVMKDGAFKSAIFVLGKDKDDPYEIEGHKFYYDNVLAEIAIKPAQSPGEAVCFVRNALKSLSFLVSPYCFVRIAFADFPARELTHPDARKVGCKSEWCAYDITEKYGPIWTIKHGCQRTAGGHIHLGGSASSLHEGHGQLAIIRMLDLFLSVPLVMIDRIMEAKRRRDYYGQAGRHRCPAHGIEYRTPSNLWLGSPQLVEFTYDICKWVVEFVEEGGHKEWWTLNAGWEEAEDQSKCHYCTYDVNRLRRCIDKNDMNDAYFWYDEIIKKKFPDWLTRKFLAVVPPDYGLYRAWDI